MKQLDDYYTTYKSCDVLILLLRHDTKRYNRERETRRDIMGLTEAESLTNAVLFL